MTIIIEIGRPTQWRPGYFRSRLMHRGWWLWFAVSLLRVPYDEWRQADAEWVDRPRDDVVFKRP